MKEAVIPGGATLWARQTIESDIFLNKPDSWFKIWFYLVNRVSHQDTKKYKRGETFLQYDWICEACHCSKDQLKKCVGWLKGCGMVSTRRSTRGVWLKIAKYSYFQTLDNYYYDVKAPDLALEKHQRSTREALRYNKNDKNDKNVSLSKDKEAKHRNKNPHSLISGETMSSIDDRDRSFPRKRTFGNEKVDWTLDYLEHKLGRNLTGQERWNRIYAKHFTTKYGMGTAKRIIEWLTEPDNWWFSKISQMATVYKNADRFLVEMDTPKTKQGKTIEELTFRAEKV